VEAVMTSSDDVLVTKQTNVLSAEELEDAIQRWQAPRMVSVSDVEGGVDVMDVKAIEALQAQAQEEGYKTGYEEGHQSGYQAGIEAAQKDIQQQVSHLQSIIELLQQPLNDLDDIIESDLVLMVMTMARQILRRELKAEPEHVIGAMRAALKALPSSDRAMKIFVHPDDLDLIRKGLSLEDDSEQRQWIEDPLLTRGGVRIETADTTIDATVEARLNMVINQLLGEEREQD
jgi:flagellar assembly protein FliH